MEPTAKAATSFFSSWRWKPTSVNELMDAEMKMLAGTKSFRKKASGVPFEQELIKLSDGELINTVKVGKGPPLVLLHGFGAGLGFWVCNLFDISQHNTVYAIDLLGFGRSSRTPYTGKTIEEAEAYFVNSIESWRKAMNLKKFTLLGHSFGGYLSGLYALQHPEAVHHLILADPWGVPAAPDDIASKYPLRYRVIASVISYVNPLSVLRVAGPYGPGLVARFRADLSQKFDHLYDDKTLISRYIYHLNAQEPQGETAFQSLTQNIAFAKSPLINRLDKLDKSIGVTLMYGSHTWMDQKAGWTLKEKLGPRAKYYTIEDSGHHIYVDGYQQFNNIITATTKANPLREEDSVIDQRKLKQTLDIPYDIEEKINNGDSNVTLVEAKLD